jgi:hypothetical protein
MTTLSPLEQLDAKRFDTPAILKKLASSSRAWQNSRAWLRPFPTRAS